MEKENNGTDASPRPKVVAAGEGGAVVVIAVFVLARMGIEVPQEVAAAAATLVAFGAAYFTKDRSRRDPNLRA